MEQAISAVWDGYQVIGPKLPLELKEIWSGRIRLKMADRVRDQRFLTLPALSAPRPIANR